MKFAIRQLLKSPGFTAVAVLTLALCLGANLTIFAVVDSVLVRPLPFPEADRLVTMFNTYPKAGVDRDGASLPNYYERRGNISAFSHLAILRYDTAIVGVEGSPEQVQVLRVSPEFFTTLGRGPALGRVFTDEEMTWKTDDVAILTDEYWRQRLNSDPKILGRQIRVDGLPKTIVGVLPPGFRFLSSKARLYFPLASNPEDRGARQRHSGNGYEMIARLQPGAGIELAQSQIDAHNAAHASEYHNAKMIEDAGFCTVVKPLHGDHVKSVRPILLLMQAGGLFLLIIGGVNLVNLLLIRASSRMKELAIRQSLGASRIHVVRQVVTETLLLTLFGGLFGLLVGAGGIRVLTVLGVHHLPLGAQIEMDSRLAMVALLGSLVLGMVVAVPIAWFNLRAGLSNVLASESRGGTTGHSAQRLRHGFIVAQIALAFILLAGAGMLGISLKRVMAVSPGFRPDHVLIGQISLPWKNYPDWPQRLALIDRLLTEINSRPGAVAAGVINNVPLSGRSGKSAINVKGHVLKPGESLRGHYSYGVSGDIFTALGIPLLEGRFIGSADSDSRVCVVDQDFARRYWPGGGAIGQRLFTGAKNRDDAEAFTVVGVVGPVKQAELTENQAQGAVYLPFKHRTDVNFFAVIRTDHQPESFGLSLQKIVHAIDPELPVNDLRSMEVRMADSLVARRSPAVLTGIFAAVALLLAAIGTYGVLSFAVAQRRREIGVRMALGALPRQVLGQFLNLGTQLLFIGITLGGLGAWALGHAMQSVLFEVGAMHAGVFFITAILMILVGLFAVLVPSRRAANMDPMEALKNE